MNQEMMNILQFQQIKEEIARYAITTEGKTKIVALNPSVNKKKIIAWKTEVVEALSVIQKSRSVPIHGLEGMEQLFKQLNKGVALRADVLVKLAGFLDHCSKLKRFMQDKQYVAPVISSYVYSIEELPFLEEEIQRCIRHAQVDDYASKALLKIRKELAIEEERLKSKLQNVVQSKKFALYLQEAIVSQRNGKYVVPVKKEYKRKVDGSVVDMSASGSTLYIEPVEIANQQEKIEMLRYREETEMENILHYLTGLVEANQQILSVATETMVTYDVIFAKAKYSEIIGGNTVLLNESHRIHLKNAKHPLLGEQAIPLNVSLGDGTHALVITGPNTGGKTVTIKTVGLLTLMMQSGLLLPVDEGSEMSIFQNIFVDIGDGQSIEQNLSTFSSRIKSIIGILSETNDLSLVLIDELGSGTDPSEGMGLAIAILDELYEKGATIFATTHFNEMKEFANNREGFINGSMEFDLNTLKPTYRLLIGKGGDSQAFQIALKLGMHHEIIEKAHMLTYKKEASFDPNDDLALRQQKERQLANNRYTKREKKENLKKGDVTVFKMGDNVKIPSENEHGIIYKGPNDKGNYIVQVKGEKKEYNHKRLSLYIRAEELYPDDYDFNIIFSSVEDRKVDHLMNRKHVDGLKIVKEE
ncbi:endonuclease MutS2 [Bacillus spongiae]|uniref:Endonuclease MutS2 n=1 Tax=Bacillus spongiae TaxID=2683610 RepID=A0ABU8HI26_9BACI